MENFFQIFLDPSNQVYQILIAVFLGVFVGLRREMFFNKEKVVGLMGIRTLPLFTLLGTISTFFDQFIYLPVIFFIGILFFVLIAYYNGVFNLKRYGLTSEVLGLTMFWVGVLVGYQEIFIGIFLTVILSIFAAYKDEFHSFAKKFSLKEWSGSLQLIIVTALILPILPKEAIDPFGIFVPFDLWLLVILISGIGFIGYFLKKYFGGKKSILTTSVLGAMVSSTATTIALAHKSNDIKRNNLLAAGVMISILVMQIRIIIEILIVSSEFYLMFILPLIVMSLVTLFFIAYFYKKDKNKYKEIIKENEEEAEERSPFEIIPSLKFAVIFTIVLFSVYFGRYYLEDFGAYIVTIIASMVDADAIVLSIFKSFESSCVENSFISNIILIAVVVNTLVKILYVYLIGNRKFFKKVSSAIAVVSFVGMIFFLIN